MLNRMIPVTGGGAEVTLLREARGAEVRISARLTAAGFNDIPRNGVLALGVIALSGGASDEFMRKVGISGQAGSEIIEALVLGGYLERRISPQDGRWSALVITGRGQNVLNVARDAIKAARWADFQFRPGDLIINTWPKSGTTWMQMICALLILLTPELPLPLWELSPWLDREDEPRDQVFTRLAGQRHRRFIKTHTSLNEVPLDPKATYIVVARHPLDILISRYHHHSNVAALSGHSPGAFLPSSRSWLLQHIGLEPSPPQAQRYLADILVFLSAAWVRRTEPNVVLVHYEDLAADLEGEMRRLAVRLGITVPEKAWPSLVKAASFEEMRAVADRLQPVVKLRANAPAFFHSGISGAGRSLLNSAEVAHYHAYAAQLASPDLLAWLHREDCGAAERTYL
jgi:aryl sulfotransferase